MTFIATSQSSFPRFQLLSHAARQFTPNWFAATMGTGVLALILGHFGSVPALYQCGQLLWVFNALLFALFSALYVAHWLLHLETARSIAGHPVLSMALGTIPMGLATIGNGFVLFGPDLLGPAAIGIAHGIWWLDGALSLTCGLGVPFLMMTRQTHSPAEMTGVWLLPLVAAEVAAVSGLLLAAHLPVADQAGVLLTSLVLWACSVPLALGLVVVLMVRMIVHGLPPARVAASCWLALGPIATGALGMVLFSQAAPGALADGALAPLAPALAGASLLLGTLLWGYGLWWVGLASLISAHYFAAPVPFNLGWWAYVFPLGVFTLATMALGDSWGNDTLGKLGLALVVMLVCSWLTVAVRTIAGTWRSALLAGASWADN
ncbi:MAG: TDT family transporter [Devosia sp.]